ncbi:MAG TPA: transglutaminase domain-containing protein, partial [Abditibacterium sp.]
EAAADEAADEAQSLRINLQLPTDQKTRIALQTIARGIVASRPSRPQTPYAKVRAINGYLMQNCLYSLSSPPVPPTEDGAVFFLTQSRVGACDMFASSMTLLLRSLDVPARVATGYLRTEPTAAGKTYLVRERDAHAWVEFYVPQLGWMPFDPTADTRSLQLAETPLAALQFPRLNWPASSLILPAAGAFLLLLGALWPILEKRRASSEPNDETALRRHIAQIYAQAQKSLHSRVPGAPHLTPHEYEDRVSRARLPLDAKQEFAALTFLFIAARYGAVPPIAAAEVEGCLKRFQRALKGRK